MKKILLTVMVSFLATGIVAAQEDAKVQAKKKEAETRAKKHASSSEAMQKAKIEADKNQKALPATAPKAHLNKAAALTVENKNR